MYWLVLRQSLPWDGVKAFRPAVAHVSVARIHTSAYVIIRQQSSAYVSIRQHTCRRQRGENLKVTAISESDRLGLQLQRTNVKNRTYLPYWKQGARVDQLKNIFRFRGRPRYGIHGPGLHLVLALTKPSQSEALVTR